MNASTTTAEHYDTIIIGAGMSGLAAGIRLAMFDRKVLILERHNAPGGLNSFYSIDGRKYDVGLHAVTNYARPGARRAPLIRLLRQLRIPFDAFDLAPQLQSKILFPQGELTFSNDHAQLESAIAEQFPRRIDAYRKLVECIRSYDDTTLSGDGGSARAFLQQSLQDPDLVEMLLLPLLYYGSARENDMDIAQSVTMFKALYLEGFSRPFEGVRTITRVLLNRYRELGGKRRMKCGVRKMITDANRVCALELDDGTTLTADTILSSAGRVETLRICGSELPASADDQVGALSFVETISVFSQQPAAWEWKDTIAFFNTETRCIYRRPEGLIDDRSGVICFPNNYAYPDGQTLSEGMLRVTALANHARWSELSPAAYTKAKQDCFAQIQRRTLSILPPVDPAALDAATVAKDMFTPTTIERFTGHLGGAVYGAPVKWRDGRTPYDNLFICGTDQGFLGIVGALLSGISMANLHVLQA